MQGWNRDADIENGLVDTVGEGEGGTNSKSSIETYILPCVKQIASGNMLYVTGSSNWVLWDCLERRDGVGSEKEVKEGEEIHVPMADSC